MEHLQMIDSSGSSLALYFL